MLALVLAVVSSQPALAATSGDGERLLAPNGAPLFIVGMNYEGPAERAWQMWDNDTFDPSAIAADFERAAKQAGVNTLRIFIQPALLADLNADKFDKLDQVVAQAENQNLQLIVSLHDYGERDLARVSAVAGKLAQHYRGRGGILAFDLKNEPRFGDLALARYAKPVELQTRVLVDTFGERLPRGEVGGYRASDEGPKNVPSYLSDDEAYIYINNLRLYRELLAEAAAWVKDHGGTTLEFLGSPDGQKWRRFVDALNATLKSWIAPQIQAIREADPTRAVTVDHVDVVLAKLPANDLLDFQSLHRYPGANAASIRANLSLLKSLARAHPGKPMLLSEFGYATENLDQARSGLAESAIMLGLVAQHTAGGAKWMLNDMPQGFNMRERTLGAFHLDRSPKPIVGALAALHAYLTNSGSPPGDFSLQDDQEVGLRFVYRASDALFLGGKTVEAAGAKMEARGPAQLFISWSEPGVVRAWASTSVKVTLDMAQVLGHDGNAVELTLQPGASVLTTGDAKSAGADYDIHEGHFFTQTNGRKDSPAGFGVTDAEGVPLWSGFKALGGVDVLGYPVTRRFEMDGFVVQAFQKTVLQWQPERMAFAYLNTFDVLHDRGLDDWLQIYRQTPPPADTAADGGLAWESVVMRHVRLLDKAPKPLIEQFLADPDWLDHYGLPVAIADLPNSVVVRAQRATLQYWKVAVPWAAKGSVTVANGGDLAKEAGVFPWLAVTPENAPR